MPGLDRQDGAVNFPSEWHDVDLALQEIASYDVLEDVAIVAFLLKLDDA
jgi:hypothetical protein